MRKTPDPLNAKNHQQQSGRDDFLEAVLSALIKNGAMPAGCNSVLIILFLVKRPCTNYFSSLQLSSLEPTTSHLQYTNTSKVATITVK